MPHKDQKFRKVYLHRYYRTNRTQVLASQKARDAMKDPEAKRAYRRAYYHANRERLLQAQRERGRRNYRANPGRYAKRQRVNALKAKFGLTPAAYAEMLAQQGGGCAICGKPQDQEKKRFPVDHCHKTGQVRGILCGNCNRALGLLQDNPSLLVRATSYLTRSSSGATSTTNRTRSSKPSQPPG